VSHSFLLHHLLHAALDALASAFEDTFLYLLIHPQNEFDVYGYGDFGLRHGFHTDHIYVYVFYIYTILVLLNWFNR